MLVSSEGISMDSDRLARAQRIEDADFVWPALRGSSTIGFNVRSNSDEI
jgi:hypothetical protein